jgi:hypothetical protein
VAGYAGRSLRTSFVTPTRILTCFLAGVFLAASPLGGAVAQQTSPVTIEKLLADGWEVTGYIAAWENRSLILFKHKDRHALMQCSVLIDVLRNPRVVTTCYELK